MRKKTLTKEDRLELYQRMLIDFSLPNLEDRRRVHADDGLCQWLRNNPPAILPQPYPFGSDVGDEFPGIAKFIEQHLPELYEQCPVKDKGHYSYWWGNEDVSSPLDPQPRIDALKQAIALLSKQ